MSLISPLPQQTIIKMYKGIPWDSEYANIRLFDTPVQRDSFLENHIIGQWSNCSVVKLGSVIKLTGQINNVLTANYLSFVNSGVGSVGSERVFYAFITAVDYINNNTIQITYSIDWIQTYLFEFDLGECYVEREHVNDDTPGKYVLEEGLETGEMAIFKAKDHTFRKAMRMLSLSQAATSVTLGKTKGILSGVEYRSSNYDGDLSYIETALTQLNTSGESNEVVDLCMCTAPMINSPNGMHESFNVENSGNLFSFGNQQYTAENNKMQCFPYKFMTIDNYEGSVQQYRYENFADDAMSFAIEGTDMPKPCMECFPINYMGWRGSSESPNTCQQMSVMFTNFPEIPWTSDTFRAWISQNSATLIGGAASKVVQAGVGAAMLATGNLAGAALLTSSVMGAAQMSENIQQHKIHSEELQGSIPSAGMSYFRDTIGFRETHYCIKPDMARRIDMYFTRYGYIINAVKTPNIRGRQFLNYVKCRKAIVTGDIAVDAENAMIGALINGTTFWHVDNIGATILTNPIVRNNV